jgi:hypothetical protein
LDSEIIKELELMILSNLKEPHNTGLIAVEEGHHLENQKFFPKRNSRTSVFSWSCDWIS